MTRDQAQLISFDKIYNLDNYEENFCRMNRSTVQEKFLYCAEPPASRFQIVINASGNLIFDEVTFCALYHIQPALQNQNKFLTFDPEINPDRRLV